MLASNSTAAATLSLANSDVSLLNYQSALYPSSAAPVAGVAQQSVSLQPGTTQICTQTDPFQQTFIVCPPAFQSKPRTLCVMLWFQSVKAGGVVICAKLRKLRLEQSSQWVPHGALASDGSAEPGQTCAGSLIPFQVVLEQVTGSCLPGLQAPAGCSTSFSPQTEHSSIPQKAGSRGARPA